MLINSVQIFNLSLLMTRLFLPQESHVVLGRKEVEELEMDCVV
jgi:hypothetical protein